MRRRNGGLPSIFDTSEAHNDRRRNTFASADFEITSAHCFAFWKLEGLRFLRAQKWILVGVLVASDGLGRRNKSRIIAFRILRPIWLLVQCQFSQHVFEPDCPRLNETLFTSRVCHPTSTMRPCPHVFWGIFPSISFSKAILHAIHATNISHICCILFTPDSGIQHPYGSSVNMISETCWLSRSFLRSVFLLFWNKMSWSGKARDKKSQKKQYPLNSVNQRARKDVKPWLGSSVLSPLFCPIPTQELGDFYVTAAVYSYIWAAPWREHILGRRDKSRPLWPARIKKNRRQRFFGFDSSIILPKTRRALTVRLGSMNETLDEEKCKVKERLERCKSQYQFPPREREEDVKRGFW